MIARVARAQEAYTISGVAWGGPHPVERIEIRSDNQPWREAVIIGNGSPHA